MSGAGALDAPFTMTSAESLLITLNIVDGATPSDYDWFYALKGCQSLSLTEGNGIAVDDVAKTVTIDPGTDYRLAPGQYQHGCLTVHKVTQQAQQVFDGEGTVTRSPNA
jgi:hypothetical protein